MSVLVDKMKEWENKMDGVINMLENKAHELLH
jgi:hypothetical protein